MRKHSSHCIRALIPTAAIVLPLTPLIAHDTEWPPAPDPYNVSDPAGPGVAMGRIQITLPTSLSSLFNQEGATWCTFGDLQGPSDGGVDILMYKRQAGLVAASLNINWAAGTGSVNPLWVWTPPSGVLGAGGESNALIYDMDGDGENEVVFHFDSTQGGDALYCLEADPAPPGGPYLYGAPAPLVLAKTGTGWGHSKRLMRVRLSDTAEPMEIAATEHDMNSAHAGGGFTGNGAGSGVEVWALTPQAGGNYPFDFTKIYEVHENLTLNFAGEETHEFNAADIDGDGYDEFFIGGVIDFVNASGGVATSINGMYGEQLWFTGASYLAHNDQMICADWLPSHPGLEIKAVPQSPYTDSHGQSRMGYDTLWDANGNVLYEGVNLPAQEGQSILGGNFTNTREGFESIQVPKKAGVVDMTCHSFRTGCYVSDGQCEPLATDGMNWLDSKLSSCPDPLPTPADRAATGPSYIMAQIDWDGDYAQDEILNLGWETCYVWRLGEKGDWLPGQLPAGMPTQAQVAQPVNYGSTSDWVFFYQGVNGTEPGRNWNNGGVGLYTHYFQKLGEAGMGDRNWQPQAFDLGMDYREEAIGIIGDVIHILYNPKPNATPNQRISPHYFQSYIDYRSTPVHVSGVFDYSALPRIEVASLFAAAGLNSALHDANGPAGGANGVLDAYELGLLFHVLQDPFAWMRPQVETAWNTNVQQVFRDAAGSAASAEQKILAAAYATLGDMDSLSAAGSLIGVGLATANYDLSQAGLLAATGDLDGDSLSNATEAGFAAFSSQYIGLALSPSFGTIMPLLGLDPLTLDINAVDTSTPTPTYFQPNGMLDNPELALLSYLIYDNINWAHDFTSDEWNRNVSRLLLDSAASPLNPLWRNLIAGYMTLGEADSQATAVQIAAALGLTINQANYSAALAPILGPAGDPDLDTLDNMNEYTVAGGAVFPYFFEATTPDFDAAITSLGQAPLVIDYNGAALYSGNGIPDGPELYLLRHLILTPAAVGHSAVKSAFHANLARLFLDASASGSLQAASLLYFAGVLTVGDADSVNFATSALSSLFGVTVDAADYDLGGSAYLSVTADPDADGRSNLVEYQNSSDQVDYAARATDPAL